MNSGSEPKSTFRILSLDGGGIRGVVTARILQEVEKILGQSITEYFDLIAGTSTGSLLAAGIALGRKPEDMMNIYSQRGEEIFDWQTRTLRRLLPGGGGYFVPFTRYKNEGLKKVLQEELRFPEGGETPKLIDVENRENSPTLLILAYDTYQGITQNFASNAVLIKPRQPSWFTQLPIWELCVCSSAAPTFFPPYQLKDSSNPSKEFNYIDGGVSANNPALAALTHAMYTKTRNNGNAQSQGLDVSDISILSIGTGSVQNKFDFKTVNQWGLVEWAEKISDIFLAAPADFETKVTRQFLSSNAQDCERYLRLNITLDKKYAAIDDPGLVKYLIQETEQSFPTLDHYVYDEGKSIKKTIEELVESFKQQNTRSSEQHFRNRFSL
jgi:patatin-like phospholipase/acyl hydrolase